MFPHINAPFFRVSAFLLQGDAWALAVLFVLLRKQGKKGYDLHGLLHISGLIFQNMSCLERLGRMGPFLGVCGLLLVDMRQVPLVLSDGLDFFISLIHLFEVRMQLG